MCSVVKQMEEVVLSKWLGEHLQVCNIKTKMPLLKLYTVYTHAGWVYMNKPNALYGTTICLQLTGEEEHHLV